MTRGRSRRLGRREAALLTRVLLFWGVERDAKAFASHFGFLNRYTENPKSNRLSSPRSLAAGSPFVQVGNDWLPPISDMHGANEDVMQGRRMQGHHMQGHHMQGRRMQGHHWLIIPGCSSCETSKCLGAAVALFLRWSATLRMASTPSVTTPRGTFTEVPALPP